MRKIMFYVIWVVVVGAASVTFWKLFAFEVGPTAPKLGNAPVQETKRIINEPIQPIPSTVDEDPRKVELGRQLFNDVRFSKDNTISCASCHLLGQGGDDNRRLSLGILGQTGKINAPTVFNAVFNFNQFWDGRASTLEEQIDGPTHELFEMASTWEEIIHKLQADSHYSNVFQEIYADGLNAANIRDAIATFERTLITPHSRFDKFLHGDLNALTEREQAGYVLFKQYGCVVCHQGVNVGGNMFQDFGKFGNYFEDRGSITEADMGRMNVTKDERDRYKFKVPGLRNVELTAPYFHDGSAKSLQEAVAIMAKYQLGVTPSAENVESLVLFLRTLTGEYQGVLLKEGP